MVNTNSLTKLFGNKLGWTQLFGLLLMCLLLICSHKPGHAEVFSDSIDIGQYQRSYIIYIPNDIEPGQRIPAVIALHGPLMSGSSMRRLFGLEEIAKREKFAVVYPNGRDRNWNDGRKRYPEEPDDVEFITKLADRLVNEEIADPRRIYLLGMATGGMLTYQIACEAPETFTAYAAIVANMPKRVVRHCKSRTPVPILMINSLNKAEIPQNSAIADWREERKDVLTSADNVEFWRVNNSCQGEPQKKIMPDTDPMDGSTVVAEQYPHCLDGASVVSFLVEGGGHLPPSMSLPENSVLVSELGMPNRDISAADISWKFFRRFSKGRVVSERDRASR
jgi:polyhydroxybutyrate depolymerase